MRLAIKIAKPLLVFLAWLIVLGMPTWFLVTTFGAKLDFWTPLEAFIHVRSWAQTLIITAFLVGGLSILVFIYGRHAIGRDALPSAGGWVAAILCLLIGIGGTVQGRNISSIARSVPPIHDITTDTVNPPEFSASLIERRGRNANSVVYEEKIDPRSDQPYAVVQAEAYPDIRPYEFDYSPRVVFSAAMEAANEMGWVIPTYWENQLRFEATTTTFWFGFVDYVSVRISEREDGGAIMDVRSSSRVGGSDLGANANRIRKFRERVSALLADTPQLSINADEAEEEVDEQVDDTPEPEQDAPDENEDSATPPE